MFEKMHQISTPKSTAIWTQFPICTSSHIKWSLIKNLQIFSKMSWSMNYDPEEFWSMVTSADWPATLTMSFILANVAPAAEIGVMATCMCCWSPAVMPTVAPVIVWYMETGIVTIPGRRKEATCSFKYNSKVLNIFFQLQPRSVLRRTLMERYHNLSQSQSLILPYTEYISFYDIETHKTEWIFSSLPLRHILQKWRIFPANTY